MPFPSGSAAARGHAECRRIRLAARRGRLESLLGIALAGRLELRIVQPGGLACMPTYRQLEDQGLAHALAFRPDGGRVVVLAGTTRVWRKKTLKRGMLAIKRHAARLGQRVLLVSERGLQRAVAQFQVDHPRPSARRT